MLPDLDLPGTRASRGLGIATTFLLSIAAVCLFDLLVVQTYNRMSVYGPVPTLNSPATQPQHLLHNLL